FGPSNEKNYKKSLSKKMTKRAITSALSYQAKAGNIVVFEGLEIGKNKMTQSLDKIMKKSKLTGKTLIVQNEKDADLIKAANNLKNIKTTVVNELNTYSILNYPKI